MFWLIGVVVVGLGNWPLVEILGIYGGLIILIPSPSAAGFQILNRGAKRMASVLATKNKRLNIKFIRIALATSCQ